MFKDLIHALEEMRPVEFLVQERDKRCRRDAEPSRLTGNAENRRPIALRYFRKFTRGIRASLKVEKGQTSSQSMDLRRDKGFCK